MPDSAQPIVPAPTPVVVSSDTIDEISQTSVVSTGPDIQPVASTSNSLDPIIQDLQAPSLSASPEVSLSNDGSQVASNSTSSGVPLMKEDATVEEMPPSQPPTSYVPSILSSSGTNTKSVLDILFAEHVLTKEQYDDVKVQSALQGKGVDAVLSAMNIVPEDKFAEARAKFLNIPYTSLISMSFSPQALSFLPRAVVDRFQLIPFFYDEKAQALSVAMADPVDLDAMAFIRQKTGLEIKAFAATPSEVKSAIEQQYRQELVGEVGAAVKETEQFKKKDKVVDSAQIGQLIKEAPIAKIVSTILEYAVTSRSSDVHIEPQDDRVRVRYRIDGILYDKLNLPKNVQEAVTSRIKILSEMKIDEHRMPQDGRFTFKVSDQEVDLRISVIPTVNGEKIVMRLLRKSGGVPTLTELGFSGTSLKNLELAITRPHGIILVCGPTGSGKTTTLYSVLSKLNTPKVNIMSLEDPVEYQMAGVNQVQINPAVGLTFASGLRSFLRQDPNIILVGEIRDKETTELAMQAALTGHLVFSTLHTSNASGSLPRLLDLGAESFLLASTVNAIVGQRIARKICESCKVAYTPAPQVFNELKTVLGPLYTGDQNAVQFYKGKGCVECGDGGFNGRVGIYEVLHSSEKISKLVLQRSDSETIEKEAVAEGMITMKQDGYLKVLAGMTTVEEVLRVAQE